MLTTKKLILVRGLPGSGKSTIASAIDGSDESYAPIHLEADMFFMENGEYKFAPIAL